VHGLRAFEVREPRFAVIDNFLRRRVCAWLQHDDCRDFFTVKLIFNTYRRCRSDIRMLVKHFIDLARVDVFTTANDHV
jgi:hypothetical protein